MTLRWIRVALLGGAILLGASAAGPASADDTLPPNLAQQLDVAAAQGQDALLDAVKAEVTANPTLAAEIAGYATKLMPDAGGQILTAVLDALPPDLAYSLTPMIVAAVEEYATGGLTQFNSQSGKPPTLPPAENPTPTLASPS